MSTLECVRPEVKPVRNARDASGRFASPADPSAIITVLLPTWTFAYQVGPFGRIYADRAQAAAFASRRNGGAR